MEAGRWQKEEERDNEKEGRPHILRGGEASIDGKHC